MDTATLTTRALICWRVVLISHTPFVSAISVVLISHTFSQSTSSVVVVSHPHVYFVFCVVGFGYDLDLVSYFKENNRISALAYVTLPNKTKLVPSVVLLLSYEDCTIPGNGFRLG